LTLRAPSFATDAHYRPEVHKQLIRSSGENVISKPSLILAS
jgi:hypothetical protein